MAEQTKSLSRKPYWAPRLHVYGTISKLTRETGCNDKKDGQSNANCRRT